MGFTAITAHLEVDVIIFVLPTLQMRDEAQRHQATAQGYTGSKGRASCTRRAHICNDSGNQGQKNTYRGD